MWGKTENECDNYDITLNWDTTITYMAQHYIPALQENTSDSHFPPNYKFFPTLIAQ